MKTLSFISEISRKFPLYVSLNVCLMTLEGVLEVGSIFTIAPVIDLLLHPDLHGISSITRKLIEWMGIAGIAPTKLSFVLLFMAVTLLQGVLTFLVKYSLLLTKYAISKNMLNELYTAFFGAKWHFFSSGSTGTMLNTFNREMVVVGSAMGSIGTMVSNAIRIVFFAAVPFYISWQITLIAISMGIIFSLPMSLTGRVSYRLGQKNTSTGNRISHVIQESLSAAKVILGFGNQNKNIAEVNKAYGEHIKVTIWSQTLNLAVTKFFEPFFLGAIIFAVYLAMYKYGISVAEVTIIAYSLVKMLPLIASVVSEKTSLANFFPSYEQVKGLISLAKANIQKTGAIPFRALRESINLNRVDFAYQSCETLLRGIDIEIRKGRFTAFVGESGAGKSTLADIIMGFCEPDTGTVIVDGTPLFDYDIVSFRKRIGYVPQDSILFHDTVRNNLLWSREDATENDIVNSCRLANAHEFIMELPNGYDTIVGDRGVRLSGGQRQRIALARALLRTPELLILDEATSSLDSQSESLIHTAIERLLHEMTIVAIAHRLSTIRLADWIYVLDRGRIVDEGDFGSLLEKEGPFRNMAEMQGLVSVL